MDVTTHNGQAEVVMSNTARAVTNIGELFAALAVGWQDGGRNNRRLIAGDGGQFIRVDPRRHLHSFYSPWPGDIPVDGGGYSLKGFIRFEARTTFRDLFTTSSAGDDVWCSAELTARGFELAQAGLLLDCTGLNHPFFFPPAAQIVPDLQLGAAVKRIAP
jgi:hypothetical protein